MRRTKSILLLASLGILTFVFGVTVTKLRPRFHKSQPTPWQTLLSFENQDLRNLRPESALLVQKAVVSLTGIHESLFVPYEPRLFRTMSNENGESRYVLVEEQPLVFTPGEARLRVHVFDMEGHLLARSGSSTGLKNVVTAMQIRNNYYFNREALVVYSEYYLGGSISAQIYVLAGNSLRLAYTETAGH